MTVKAKCPKCSKTLKVVVGAQNEVRVAYCRSCRTEYQYSAWNVVKRDGLTLTQVDLEETL